MKKITVNASRSYEIIIGKGILSDSGEYCLTALGKTCRVCILSDDNVAPLYLDKVKGSLQANGFDTIEYVIPHGEASKNTQHLVELVEFMAMNRLTRSDALIALGGGVVGDLGGFAASVYLRGIPFIQMPTTLLAAVDSSVGGKTAVDLVAGKNLMGAFYQPSLVLCDCAALDTLPREIFADGCAEVIKYGVINDPSFFEYLEGSTENDIETVIATCVKNKADIVMEDEFDKGKRQLLNLGHTVGHAIELCSDLKISHGSAVAIGMTVVTRAAYKLGICTADDLNRLISTLEAYALPTECPYSAKELTKIATADKKRSGDKIALVVPHGIGSCELMPIPVSELCDFIEKGLEK